MSKAKASPKVPSGLPGSPDFKGIVPNPASGLLKAVDGAAPPTMADVPAGPPVREVAASSKAPEFDPFGAGEELPIEEEFAVSQGEIDPASPEEAYTAMSLATGESRTVRPAPPPKSTHQKYLERRISITLELADTLLMVKAIDMIETPYAVTLLLPVGGDGFTFIPKPGSSVTIRTNKDQIPCFFPGTSFEIEGLGMMGLAFVKETAQDT